MKRLELEDGVGDYCDSASALKEQREWGRADGTHGQARTCGPTPSLSGWTRKADRGEKTAHDWEVVFVLDLSLS